MNSTKQEKSVRGGRILRILLCVILTLSLALGRIAQWIMTQASLSLDEILFTLKSPVEGTDSGFYWSIFRFSMIPALAVLFVIITIQILLDSGVLWQQRGINKRSESRDAWILTVRRNGQPDGISGLRRMLRKWFLPAATAASVLFCVI